MVKTNMKTVIWKYVTTITIVLHTPFAPSIMSVFGGQQPCQLCRHVLVASICRFDLRKVLAYGSI